MLRCPRSQVTGLTRKGGEMLRRNKFFAISVTVGALVLVGCTSSGGGGSSPSAAATSSSGASVGPQRGGALKLAAGVDVVTLDNSQAVSTIDYSLTAGALYEGLYHVDSQGSV